MTEAAVERLDHEDAAMVVDFLVDDLRDLKIELHELPKKSLPSYFE